MTTKIGILTGGGDCPGLNGAVKWVVKTALDPLLAEKRSRKFEVLGIREGWKGLVNVDPDDERSRALYLEPLDEEKVRTWDRTGGTNLGTSRTNPFNPATRLAFTLAGNGLTVGASGMGV
ncbi:MAG TPA: 6-phosphofructokinase, partial [Deltaproteobacteria bacterium]|nr:6-phosphofructokinase [Deltaproteobacteria bacterium]